MRDSGLMNIWNTHEMILVDIRKDGAALRCGAAPFFLQVYYIKYLTLLKVLRLSLFHLQLFHSGIWMKTAGRA